MVRNLIEDRDAKKGIHQLTFNVMRKGSQRFDRRQRHRKRVPKYTGRRKTGGHTSRGRTKRDLHKDRVTQIIRGTTGR